MNTTNLKHKLMTSMLGATVAAAAVVALSFAGAGPAQAAAPDCATNPKIAPCYSVSLESWPGGLTVHVVDNATGVSGTCTYSADWYHSLPFFLPAGGTADVVIVPSFPEGRSWNVTVACDNGGVSLTTVSY